jgi:hypothetical protein
MFEDGTGEQAQPLQMLMMMAVIVNKRKLKIMQSFTANVEEFPG